MTVGVGEDYPVESSSIEGVRRDFDAMARAGVTTLRVSLPWDHIEPRPGEYDWRFWDGLFREAAGRGITLLPYVCYTPAWAVGAGAADPWRRPPRDANDFARFVSAAVTRYRGKAPSWELWNEPDNADYWTGTLEQYAQLVRAGSAAVRAADPSAKVVLGGISWNVDFLRRLFRDQHVSGAVDVVNVHNYAETWIPDPLERLPESIGRVRDVLTRYGAGQQVWAAEVGYSDYRRGRAVSADYDSRYDYEHTPDYQADDLFRAMVLLRASGVATATWYRINDLPTTQAVIGDVNNRHLGLVTTAGLPKPASAALRRFIDLLGQPARCIDADVRIDRSGRSDAEVHAFQRADGSVVVVLWLKTYVPGEEPAASAGETDRREERVTLTLPLHVTSAATTEVHEPHDGAVRVVSGRSRSRIGCIPIRGGTTVILTLRGPE